MRRHLSRLNMPRSWPIERKKTKWITRPNPGPHSLDMCMPLGLLLKEVLKCAKTTRETKEILNQGLVKVDNKIRKDYKFPVGLMDILGIQNINYRILVNKKGRFVLHKITKEESNVKPRKIIGKTSLKNKAIQINFLDGSNKILKKDAYSVSDTLLFDLEKNEIKDHLKLEKDGIIYLVKGKYIGQVGVIKSIEKSNSLSPKKITFSVGAKTFETFKDYALVIGKDKPVISVQASEK